MISSIGDRENGLSVDLSAGGRISSLVLEGRERILVQPAEGIETSFAWGSFLMAPFVGRVSRGQVSWDGKDGRLPLNDGANSIHGAVYDRQWDLVERTDASIEMSCQFDPARWPFRGSARQRLRMEPGRLVIEAQILATDPMPAALGWHPWFADPEGRLLVKLESDSTLQLEPDLIPTGNLLRVDARTDLRRGGEMRSRKLDDVYAAVRGPVSVTWPDIELIMTSSPQVRSFVVCNHPQAVAVEPMTAWPDAVRLSQAGHGDTGVVALGAGESLTASTTWTWRKRS